MTELSKDKKQQIELSNEDFDKLINRHIEKMWGGLEMASVKHFMDTGKVNGSFRLRLLSLMKFYQWKHEELNATAEATKALILIEALEKIKRINQGFDAHGKFNQTETGRIAADALNQYNAATEKS